MKTSLCLLLLSLVACTADKDGIDTNDVELPFCEKVEDFDTTYPETGGGQGESGVLVGRLVSDETEELHDPQMVAYVALSLENLDSGGTERSPETDIEGNFTYGLGGGRWRIRVGERKVGFSCNNELEFEIVAGDTLYMCMDLNCT
jgi:hypothetical protein